MMTLLIIIGWAVFFLVAWILAHVFHVIARECHLALKLIKVNAMSSDDHLPVGKAVFFLAGHQREQDQPLQAPFSQVCALYVHTLVERYSGRRKETVMDKTQKVPFQLVRGSQIISLPDDDNAVIWVLPKVDAYHGLVGRITDEQRQRLLDLDIQANNRLLNPHQALTVTEEVLPVDSEIYVFGKVIAESADKANQISPTPAKLRLQGTAAGMLPVIATSRENLIQELRYARLSNRLSSLFVFALPCFALWIIWL